MEIFTERLKSARENASFTMNGLGREVGLMVGNYSPYERQENARIPSILMAAKFATALKVSLDYLAGLTDDPRPVNQILKSTVPTPPNDAEYQAAENIEITRLKADNEKLKAQITKLQAAISALIKD